MSTTRPHTRPDGIMTRIDTQYWSAAERAIAHAMQEVEASGASPALTDAVTLLSEARDRVADHVEDLPSAKEHKTRVSLSSGGVSGEKVYTQAEVDALIAAAIDQDRIAGFMEFAKNLPDKGTSVVYGTNLQARAIFRALRRAGY